MFAGSDGGARRWVVVGSLVETAKLNGVEPHAWLRDVLSRMVDGHPQQHFDQLLPWNQACVPRLSSMEAEASSPG